MQVPLPDVFRRKISWRPPGSHGPAGVGVPTPYGRRGYNFVWTDLRIPDRNQSSTLVLNFFNFDLRRFPSRIRFFNARGRGERWRRIFSRRLSSAARACCRCRSIAPSNRSRASLRLRACERESCTVTRSPEGKWRSVTAVDTLLTFWPPGPPDRAKTSSRSDSSTPSSFIHCSTERPVAMGSPSRAARCFRGRGARHAPSTRARRETCSPGPRNSRPATPRFH